MTAGRSSARTHTALALAVALLFQACSYRSEVEERRELAPLLVKSDPRREDPESERRTVHVVEHRREAGQDVFQIEERVLADFVTAHTEQPRTEIVYTATVNDLGAWWILPITADLTHAMWVDNDDPGLGTLIGWCIGVPITVAFDAVFGIPHILRMIGHELNEIELASVRDASVRERDVIVDRHALLPLVSDAKVLVDNRAWLLPVVDEAGGLRFDATAVAPLDDAPLPGLVLVAQRDDAQVLVDLPWPTAWRKTARTDLGLDMRDDVAAVGGRGQATARAPARITPGVPATLSVVVTAEGSGDLCRLVGETSSRHPWLDGRVLNFGRLSPGQSSRVDVELLVPDTLPSTGERVTVTFRCSRGRAPDDVQVVLRTGVAAPDR